MRTDFKSRISGPATALGLGLLVAFGGASANDDAQAQQPVAQQVSTTQIKIPMSNAQGLDPRGVQMAAAAASKSAQVVVFFGDSTDAYESMKDGVRAAIAQGIPVRGVIVASPLTPVNVNGVHIAGSNQIQFYADTELTATIDNPGANVGQLVLQNLRDDYRETIIPLRAMAMNSPAPNH